MELVNDFGIYKIVAHIAFKYHSGVSGTFSTPSTDLPKCLLYSEQIRCLDYKFI
jgi:hypothetical protein